MGSNKLRPIKDKFEGKLLITPGCWFWQGTIGGNNKYGYMSHDHKTLTAHRVSYDMYVGPIPPGMNVLHKCDVPRCVNPDHLFLGTHLDNMRDMVAKGRWKPPTFRIPPRGEQQASAKLTESQVISIRNDARLNIHIASEYGVSGALVGMIKSRKLWKHV